MTTAAAPVNSLVHPGRITVGVILDNHLYTSTFLGMFASGVINGIRAAARDHGINLLVACGISRSIGVSRFHPAWPEPGPDTDFVPVGPWNTDGLLVFSPLRMEERIRYIRGLEDRGFPLLFIGGGSGRPTIMVDNEGGIQQAVEHLVHHGHRSIVFVAGDEKDPGDSRARLDAYRQSVRELGLDDDPRLIVYGQHWDEAAEKAVAGILEAGVRFTAVVGSNDQNAVGASRAIHAAGLHIPWDVAVTGFDDVREGLAQIPPLTSVHYPLFETGYRALLLLQKRIESGPEALPDEVRVSTWLVPRQSCGCLPGIVVNAAIPENEAAFWAERTEPPSREELVERMLDSLLRESPSATSGEIYPLCGRLVDAYQQSLDDGDLSHFQIALMEILQRVETMTDEDAHVWQAAINVLHAAVRANANTDTPARRLDRAEDMLHQARILLCESAQRRYARFRLIEAGKYETMGRLTSRLISTSDTSQVFAVLREELPHVGITGCVLAQYEGEGKDPFRFSRIRILAEGAPEQMAETRAFPPPGLYADESPFHLSLLPLVQQNKEVGFLAPAGAGAVTDGRADGGAQPAVLRADTGEGDGPEPAVQPGPVGDHGGH
jgi:DNA-binding LacI/PurR family transcriptional regulator